MPSFLSSDFNCRTAMFRCFPNITYMLLLFVQAFLMLFLTKKRLLTFSSFFIVFPLCLPFNYFDKACIYYHLSSICETFMSTDGELKNFLSAANANKNKNS